MNIQQARSAIRQRDGTSDIVGADIGRHAGGAFIGSYATIEPDRNVGHLAGADYRPVASYQRQ